MAELRTLVKVTSFDNIRPIFVSYDDYNYGEYFDEIGPVFQDLSI